MGIESTNFYFIRKDWPCLQLTGKEAQSWLHSICSQDIETMQVGDSALGSFLTGIGKLIAKFVIYKADTFFLLFFEPLKKTAVQKHLEFMHFGEELEFMWNKDYYLIDSNHDNLDLSPQLSAEPFNSKGALYLCRSSEPIDKTKFATLKELTTTEYFALRASFVFPQDGVEILDSDILLEANLKEYISEDKGCYPGQEVVAKIITYGKVAKHICLLQWQGSTDLGDIFNEEGASVGELRSVYQSKANYYGIAYIKRLAVEKYIKKDAELILRNGNKVLRLIHN